MVEAYLVDIILRKPLYSLVTDHILRRECMNIQNRKWYTFNDSSVRETSMRTEEEDSSSPYILFYVKSSCIA